MDKSPADKKGLAKADFAKASDSERIKEEQKFLDQFKTERGRSSAKEAELDAREARNEANTEFADKVEKINESLSRLDLSRPVPPEFAISMNEKLQDALDKRDNDFKEIESDFSAALGEIQALEIRDLEIGPLGEDRQITYSPTHTKTFNRAAEGIDI